MTDLFPGFDQPFACERTLQARGLRFVCGVDEAGRGALAGPVVAAAVILRTDCDELIGRVRDSKLLSAGQREDALTLIEEHSLSVGVGTVEADEIDRTDILRATFEAMRTAIAALRPAPDIVLVDGTQRIPGIASQRTIVKGDRRVMSIAAASIVAKVTRDRLMRKLAADHPLFGFERHKGYGVPSHIEALRRFGPSAVHRLSFHLGT